MRRRTIIIAGGVAMLAMAAGAAALVVAAAEPGHTPLHVGCKNHNHGPKWHAGHGRALGQPQSRFARPEPDNAADTAPVTERAITAPMPGGRP